MALVVLIANPGELDSFTEQDMRRWWRQKCKKHCRDGEVYFEVASPVRFNVYEGIERLKSFGVKSRAAYRSVVYRYY